MTTDRPAPNAFAREQLDVLRRIVERDFRRADRAHDFDHIERVERLAARLAAAEGGDVDLARAAALVHDYHRLDGAYGLGSSGDSGNAAARVALEACGAPDPVIRLIAECVAYTDQYAIAGDELVAPSIEAAVVRDADNLDAMGAIGIARAFVFGATLDEPMWRPDAPVRRSYDRGHAPSVIHHFYEKLLLLHDELGTEAGRALGAVRHAELERFVEAFRAEWDAER